MDNLLQDVRYGIRTLLRQPGFAATAVLTLALGIGATTAIFSVVNAVVLRPMPFDEPERVMAVTSLNLKTGTRYSISGPDFFDWRAQARSFEALSYFTGVGETSVTVNNVSDYTAVVSVAPGYFDVFGATASKGRLFTPEEQRPGGGSDVVVITDAYWRRQFGSDPRAIGSTITSGQHTATIIGVTALRYPARTDIYYPDPDAPESRSRTATTIAASGDSLLACPSHRRNRK